uniref:Neuropeptide-like 4 n=1 Tax=Rhabditophanes sp. KR3021 TaxID=114890 RepID=A0AC35TMY9_9BILA
MNFKTITALIAFLIGSASAQYYYSPYAASYAYGYPYAPVAVAPAVVPSSFAPVVYGWGSNKGKGGAEKPAEDVKLTNN